MVLDRDRRISKKQKKQSHKAGDGGGGGGNVKLAWKPVPLPQEAIASGGQSEADFFRGLNFDDEDYMGIKEVEGVEVVKKSDGTVALVDKASVANTNNKEKEKQTKKPQGQKRKAREEVAKESGILDKMQEEQNREQPTFELETDLSEIVFSDEGEEEETGSSEDQNDIQKDEDDSNDAYALDEELKADFKVLAEDEGDDRGDRKWSKKEYCELISPW